MKLKVPLCFSKSFKDANNKKYVHSWFRAEKNYLNLKLQQDSIVLVKDVLEAFDIPITLWHFVPARLTHMWRAPINIDTGKIDKRYKVKIYLKENKKIRKPDYEIVMVFDENIRKDNII